ncbi:ATP-dependent DNA helicase DinG [Aneurinibacillus uraniidurans]|uniref:ATP-dependent DNA helicase DinG n=1 Tax=Aneurinibacillus uraniidurans TaxID=2966586 RepID=UPI00234A0906|nr:ATP-dependent DNA helicase DinG [Aneurinibacillus sp. B1]WCN36672.1 ATP-dependent DNA helicase DinG [Aneurinibacillus sp. B1]
MKRLNTFAVVDFETTGNRPKEGDRIIQIGAVLVRDGEIVDRFASLVNPEVTISPFIEKLTGITDEMVADAPRIEDVLPQLLKMLDGAVFVAHNVFFDLSFLQNALADAGYRSFTGPLLDTVELSRLLLPAQEGYRLSDLAVGLDIMHDRPHQADSDAEATAYILLHLLKKLRSLPLLTIQRLRQMSRSFHSDIESLLADVEQAKVRAGEYEPGEMLEAVHQICLKRRLGTERLTDSPLALDGDFLSFVDGLFGEDGALAAYMPGFELRPAQVTMMKQVYESFESGRHLLVEAGTGTGKSLAYLIPAVYWAKQQQEKVVISTHTIQLQEQMYDRDLPILTAIFGEDAPRISVLKGRNNYVCMRKFAHSLEETQDNYDVQLSKSQMLVWLTETETGDAEGISLPSGGQVYWKQVQSDSNSCLNRQCQWFSRCYYHQARRRAQQAEVIVTNHSLLFTDMHAEHRILPAYGYAVIDEAHHFEEVASHHLGDMVSSYQVEGMLARLHPDKGVGLLEEVEIAVQAWDQGSYEESKHAIETAYQLVREAKDTMREMYQMLYQWSYQRAREAEEVGHTVMRYKPDDLNSRFGRAAVSAVRNGVDMLLDVGRKLELIYAGIHGDDAPSDMRGLLTDLGGVCKDCQSYAELLHNMVLQNDDEYVYWIELDVRSSTRRGIYLHRVPIDVSGTLRELFFDKKESVVLTSATLSVQSSFRYASDRLGLADLLAEGSMDTAMLASPFHYKEQTLVCIPSDIPSIKGSSEAQFVQALIDSLAQVAITTRGRMLVLFTSYSMLKVVYEPLKERLKEADISVLGHGVDGGSRTKLTKQFRTLEACVLLGTSSFWEGIDIPGEDLSCVAIVRLPFVPPNHPLTEARNQQLEAERKNAFMQLSVPQAVIRFKQGFGRLIRTSTDRGVVLVYDRRIVEARYGRLFLQSLPETTVLTKPTTELLDDIADWLDKP